MSKQATGARVRTDLLTAASRSIVLIAVVFALLGTYSERWQMSSLAGELGTGPVRVGAAAPLFQTTTLTGETASLEQFRGRVVVLNFWATWCPPCRVEMPDLDAYQAEMGDRVAVLGINMGEPVSAIAPFVREYRLTFPILLDESGAIAATYGITGLPTSIILDRAGTVRDRVVGAMTRDALARRAERVL